MSDAKRASESELVLRQQMLPDDANSSGDVHGGVIMKLVDTAAGLVAMRHSRSRCVTVVVDSMTFKAPVHIGDLVHVAAVLTWTGNTSMEMEVRVEAENVLTGEVRHTSTAWLVYVALDEQGNPAPVAPLLVETETGRQHWRAADQRRAIRLGRAG